MAWRAKLRKYQRNNEIARASYIAAHRIAIARASRGPTRHQAKNIANGNAAAILLQARGGGECASQLAVNHQARRGVIVSSPGARRGASNSIMLDHAADQIEHDSLAISEAA